MNVICHQLYKNKIKNYDTHFNFTNLIKIRNILFNIQIYEQMVYLTFSNMVKYTFYILKNEPITFWHRFRQKYFYFYYESSQYGTLAIDPELPAVYELFIVGIIKYIFHSSVKYF